MHVAPIHSCSVTSLGSKENRCFHELHLAPPIFYPHFGDVFAAQDCSCWGQWELGT